MDEIGELRRRGVRVICCSGRRVPLKGLNSTELEFREESFAIHPLRWIEIARAAHWLAFEPKHLRVLLHALHQEKRSRGAARLRAYGHTILGAALANQLAAFGVEHIHAHHGYFASWMALVAAELLDIGFSFTLHGSDLLLGRADFLAAKLERCAFCVTVSNFNRDFILERYPSTPASKVVVQRLGVDSTSSSKATLPAPDKRRAYLLSVGRLHAVKNHQFLIEACAALRDEGRDFVCWIAGEGPERHALERQIEALQLEGHVLLPGMIPRAELSRYYRLADLFVLTSRSEGIPVTLMEAMAHGRLTLAPAITGIPELVQHGRTGFLYEGGSMPDFLSAVRWILNQKDSLKGVRHAAAESISVSFDRQRNLGQFADQFLNRIGHAEEEHENSILQQVQLSV
jgi:colanic acid/amylovoran biosynthesis glycosyltransferase